MKALIKIKDRLVRAAPVPHLGRLRAWQIASGAEATVKVCGVAVAMLPGQRVRGHEKVPTSRSSCLRSLRPSIVMNAEERMDVIAAFREMGSYRGAAELCGTTHKTVKRIVLVQQGDRVAEGRRARPRNFDGVAELVTERVEKTRGRISAKRLLPKARAAGYAWSARNFR